MRGYRVYGLVHECVIEASVVSFIKETISLTYDSVSSVVGKVDENGWYNDEYDEVIRK